MFLKSIFRRKKRKIKQTLKYKFDINNWMNLTKEERLEMDIKEKDEIMRRKKELLKSIRDEYIKIKNNKS
tara:strand:+ start:140 stop:349 length:210 start_codon:yes stop_codon:yes gene_type:complete